MSRTPDVITAIQRAIITDDDNQSERLVATYEAADEATKATIDDTLINVCGYSLMSLITQATSRGHFVGED